MRGDTTCSINMNGEDGGGGDDDDGMVNQVEMKAYGDEEVRVFDQVTKRIVYNHLR